MEIQPGIRRRSTRITLVAALAAATAAMAALSMRSAADARITHYYKAHQRHVIVKRAPRYQPMHTADKLVPILSVGTGARVGAAIVTGPSVLVAKVAAVGQIEARYKNIVGARILVPISNPQITKGLHRVPECSVYAVGTYRL